MKLVVISGKKKGTEIPLTPGETTIGREAENTIRLTSSTVSRKHAIIVVQNGSMELRDLKSTSGTYVDGNKIETAVRIGVGSTIQIGEYAFRVVGADGARPRATATGTAASAVRTGGSQAIAVRSTAASTRGTGPSRPVPVPSAAAARAAGQGQQKFMGLLFTYQILGILGIVVIAAIAAMVMFFAQTRAEFTDYAITRAELLTQNMALRNGEELRVGRTLQLNTAAVEDEPGVKGAWVMDRRGNILAPKDLKGRQFQNQVSSQSLSSGEMKKTTLISGNVMIAMPMRVFTDEDGALTTVGVVAIEFAPHEVAASLAKTQQRLFIGAIFLALAVFLAYRLFSRAVRGPIGRLQEDTELMIQGLLPKVGTKSSMEELVEMAASINRLAARSAQAAAAAAAAVARDPVSAAYGPSPTARLALPGGAATAPVAESALIAMVGALPDPALVVDDASNVMLMNPPAGKVFGTRPDVAKGKHLLEVVKDEALVGVLLDLISQLTNGDQDVVTQEVSVGGVNRSVSASAVRAGNELAAAAVIMR